MRLETTRITAWLAAIAFAAVLTGCATTSRVEPATAFTLTVTASASQARGGIAAAKRRAYGAAAAECGKAGMKAVLVSERGGASSITSVMAEVTIEFRCSPTATENASPQ